MMKNISYIINTLNENGFQGYVVGGWVRDNILNLPSSDVDFATDANPETVGNIFALLGHRVIPTGIEHGTVTVIVNDTSFEITTFRKDVSCDGRNATVEFSNSIFDDLARRDFTFNAIAYNPEDGSYCDPHSGILDLKRGIIKTVGWAYARFREDYLRVFRTLRFATVFDHFIVDGNTWHSLVKVSNETTFLDVLSVERIRMEINKVFEKSERPSIFFILLRNAGILHQILPELQEAIGFEQNSHHADDVFMHTMLTLDATPKENSLLRWVALLHDLGKVKSLRINEKGDRTFSGHEDASVEMAEKILERFKFSNDNTSFILHMIQNHMRSIPVTAKNSAVRRLILNIGKENLENFLTFKKADRLGNRNRDSASIEANISYIRSRVEEVLNSATEAPVFDLKHLEIDGHDVQQILGIAPGPEIGRVLKALYNEVVENPELNNREYLLNRVKEKGNDTELLY